MWESSFEQNVNLGIFVIVVATNYQPDEYKLDFLFNNWKAKIENSCNIFTKCREFWLWTCIYFGKSFKRTNISHKSLKLILQSAETGLA